MESAFSEKRLSKELQLLSEKKQLAFGACCCERIIPNYDAFQMDTNWGDVTPIKQALELVWAMLGNEEIDSTRIQQLLLQCEIVAPDSEDFESLYVSFAQDACFAVCGLLDFLLCSDVGKIVQAASYAMSSVDLYVQEAENMDPRDPLLEKKILEHPLMQRELAQQRHDLTEISRAPSLDNAFLTQLRSSWANHGRSNLDLP